MAGRREEAVWKTRDGRVYVISEMSDAHLLNTIAYLMRRAGDAVKVDGVTYVLDYKKPFVVWETNVFEHLVDEAISRGLDWDMSTRWQPPTHILTLKSEDGALALPVSKPGVERDPRPGCLVARTEIESTEIQANDNAESAENPV